MMLEEQVYAQALLLAGEMEPQQESMLQFLCRSAVASLSRQMRSGLTAEDCKADFIAAASLYALAALSDIRGEDQLREFSAGDITIRRNSSDAAARCLRNQAELMIAPYLKDRFSFLGV